MSHPPSSRTPPSRKAYRPSRGRAVGLRVLEPSGRIVSGCNVFANSPMSASDTFANSMKASSEFWVGVIKVLEVERQTPFRVLSRQASSPDAQVLRRAVGSEHDGTVGVDAPRGHVAEEQIVWRIFRVF